jgi:hypothetical protein
MTFDATLLMNLGRVFAHESGHAIMATLKQIPYCGIAYNKDEQLFCTLTHITVVPTQHTPDHYLYFAAGVAAERMLFAQDEESEGGKDDRKFFESVCAPDFEITVTQAQAILSARKNTIEYLVARLKATVKGIRFDFDPLEEVVVDGRKCAILLSERDLKSAIDSSEKSASD